MKLSLFNGSLPKIGIRPTIDGRLGGVRVSVEKQEKDMANSAAQLISSSLRYPNGKRVECVIADPCIGGVAEAAACAEKFAREGVGLSLTVTPCWCYGSETMDMNPSIPKAAWGFKRRERPGGVGSPGKRLSRRCAGKNSPLRPRRSGGGVDARQIVSRHGRRFDGHRRFDCGSAVFRELPRHEGRDD